MELPLLSPAAENSSPEESELDIDSVDKEEELRGGTETQPSRWQLTVITFYVLLLPNWYCTGTGYVIGLDLVRMNDFKGVEILGRWHKHTAVENIPVLCITEEVVATYNVFWVQVLISVVCMMFENIVNVRQYFCNTFFSFFILMRIQMQIPRTKSMQIQILIRLCRPKCWIFIWKIYLK
jgi:hypothetical protein